MSTACILIKLPFTISGRTTTTTPIFLIFCTSRPLLHTMPLQPHNRSSSKLTQHTAKLQNISSEKTQQSGASLKRWVNIIIGVGRGWGRAGARWGRVGGEGGDTRRSDVARRRTSLSTEALFTLRVDSRRLEVTAFEKHFFSFNLSLIRVMARNEWCECFGQAFDGF